MYFRLSESERHAAAKTVNIFLYQGGYAGLELVEGQCANLCLIIAKEKFASLGKNWEKLLEYLRRASPLLNRYLQHATALWDKPLSVFGIPYGFVFEPTPRDDPSLFRLGDQMAVIPSLCGDGMAIALHTGFLAAKCYVHGNAQDYHRVAARQLGPQIRDASYLAFFLSNSLLQPAALALCKLMPFVAAKAIERTRVKYI
jgi:hypothetical protein